MGELVPPRRAVLLIHSSGLGFGICQRLLFQLCDTHPTDSLPQSFAKSFDTAPKPDGLTLILACRSRQRAEVARTDLLRLLDTHVSRLQKQPGYDGHAHEFRKNVVIDVVILDLAELSSVFKFAEDVASK